MAVLNHSQIIARNQLKGNNSEEMLFVYCFDVWPGTLPTRPWHSISPTVPSISELLYPQSSAITRL